MLLPFCYLLKIVSKKVKVLFNIYDYTSTPMPEKNPDLK